MKQFITAAAFLAASTALASAAYTSSVYNGLGESYLLAYWSFDGDVSSVSDYTHQSGFSAPTWGEATGTTTPSGGVLGSGYAAYGENGDLTLTPNATLPGSESDASSNLAASTFSFFIQLNENSSGTVWEWKSQDGLGTVSVDGYTLTVGSASYNLTSVSQSSDWVNVTLTTNWGNSAVFVNGEAAVATAGDTTFSPSGQGLDVQFAKQCGANTPETNAYLTNANLDEIALWQGVTLSQDQIKTYATLGIPEPSAFGLLAGMGALAFVAARRRRSRKA